MVGLGQDPAVSAVAKTFVCIMLPGIWAMGQFDATKKFLSSQQLSRIPVVTQIFTTILHLLMCWLFIKEWKMKEVGAAIATSLTYILNMVISDIWIR